MSTATHPTYHLPKLTMPSSSNGRHDRAQPPIGTNFSSAAGWENNSIWTNNSPYGAGSRAVHNGTASPKGSSESASPSAPVSATTQPNLGRSDAAWPSRPQIWAQGSKATQPSSSNLQVMTSPTRARDKTDMSTSGFFNKLPMIASNGSSIFGPKKTDTPVDYPYSAIEPPRENPFESRSNRMNGSATGSYRRNSSDPFSTGISAGQHGSIASRGSDGDPNFENPYPFETSSASTQRPAFSRQMNPFNLDNSRQRITPYGGNDAMSDLTDGLNRFDLGIGGETSGGYTNGSFNPAATQTFPMAQSVGWPSPANAQRRYGQGYQQDNNPWPTRDSYSKRPSLGAVSGNGNSLRPGFSSPVGGGSGGLGNHPLAPSDSVFLREMSQSQEDLDHQQQLGSYLSSHQYQSQQQLQQQQQQLQQQQQQSYFGTSAYFNSISQPQPQPQTAFDYRFPQPLPPLVNPASAVNQFLPTPAAHFRRNNEPNQGRMRSVLLEDFRQQGKNNSKKPELKIKEIQGHVVEFSGDQHGSRLIQDKLQTANSDDKDQVFREIEPNALQLMKDVFGNYVIQKFFEHGNQVQKRLLASQMVGKVPDLSMQMYACRVVQKALEHVLVEQQQEIVNELKPKMLNIIHDGNGNHVIQKVIEIVPRLSIPFLMETYNKEQLIKLAKHSYGCRIIQRILEYGIESEKLELLGIMHANAEGLIADQFGNYVAQHIIEKGPQKDRDLMIALVMKDLIYLSKHKFASNVVEKCIQYGSDADRKQILDLITKPGSDGNTQLPLMIKDQYGNYVIQKMLAKLEGDDCIKFTEQVNLEANQLKKTSANRQLQAVDKVLDVIKQQQSEQKELTNGVGAGPQGDSSAVPTPALSNTEQNSPQSTSAPSTNQFGPEDAAEDGSKGPTKYQQNGPIRFEEDA